jgi:aldose 1-epimerase
MVFFEENAILLKASPYEAAVLPGIGANMIAFRDIEKGFRFIREPREIDIVSFKAWPVTYGIPILFPPNRYEGGKFPWQGKVYQFPVNEKAIENHLHGFFIIVPGRYKKPLAMIENLR